MRLRSLVGEGARVAGSRNKILNLLHRGLLFLHALQKGSVRLTQKSEVRCPAVITVIYFHDVLVTFEATLNSVLQCKSILQHYNLDPNVDYRHQWRIGTPDSLIGVEGL